MDKREVKVGARASFPWSPSSPGKVLFGVAAVVAMGSFTLLVFGPLADQRAMELAGHAQAATGGASAPAQRRVAWTLALDPADSWSARRLNVEAHEPQALAVGRGRP